MGSILKVLQRQHHKQMERKWYETYWMVDMHGVIIHPDYSHTIAPLVFYPYALASLNILTSRPDIRIILYTCSHEDQINHYVQKLKEQGIKFDYINVNPEIGGKDDFGCYDKKPYFDVYLDDKAGFDPDVEWRNIFNFLTLTDQPKEEWKNPVREERRKIYKYEQFCISNFKEVQKKHKEK